VNAVVYALYNSVGPFDYSGSLYELSWKVGDKQWNYLNLTQDAVGLYNGPGAFAPVSVARSAGLNTVTFNAYNDNGRFIAELVRAPGAAHWSENDLYSSGSAYGQSSNVIGAVACYRNLAVYVGYSEEAGNPPHIFQLGLPPFAGRYDPDLNVAVPTAVLPARFAMVASYVRSDDAVAIVYSGADNDSLHELVYPPGGSWQVGGQLAKGVGFVNPFCYVRSDGVNAIVYRGPDNHIYELAGNSELSNLTKLFGAPLAAGDPFCYVRSDKVNSVVYPGFDNLIHELYLVPGQDWHHGTLPTPVPLTTVWPTPPWV
jgi:hypothetical protein